MLNVARIISESKIYGPGTRTVIWFQGCSIRCDGCINQELLNFVKKRQCTTQMIISQIKNSRVTLLGGEPLDQIDLLNLLVSLKKAQISVVLFTGYEWNNISQQTKEIIQSCCDMVISGPYIAVLKDDSLYLRGSTNQQIHVFNNLQSTSIAEKRDYEIVISNEIEVRGRIYKDIFELIEDGGKEVFTKKKVDI